LLNLRVKEDIPNNAKGIFKNTKFSLPRENDKSYFKIRNFFEEDP